MENFIDHKKIEEDLENGSKASSADVKAIVDKALGMKGLTTGETATLLQCEDNEIINSMFDAARKLKEEIYGKRLVFFAPLYLSNICVNNCLYCGFRMDNKELNRKILSMDEIRNEVELLEKEGHKRLLLVAGEDNETANIEYLEKAIDVVYDTKVGKGEIRRVNINVAPQTVENYKRLKAKGIGTYQVFQETYHKPTYEKVHISGPKSDYLNRLYAMDKAMEGGIDDVGIGALFGLYDYKFEAMGLLYHSQHLDEKYGVGPHTISVPRLEPAFNAPVSAHPPSPVSDEEFKKLVAVLRLAVPYTGIILSTRETAELRNDVFALGISQISAGSRTNPGGYSESKGDAEQFTLHDSRSMAEVVKDICQMGYSPSFCTACYRLGRTGKDFMDLAKPGLIRNFCLPNSLLTFKEYLIDYADDELKKIGDKVIEDQLNDIQDESRREDAKKKLKELDDGKRDLYF
ncbi:[FeFe] hydrogenase H-cluster radical SAM maturase HydG [Candidatus Undinarchaeota archaeon]